MSLPASMNFDICDRDPAEASSLPPACYASDEVAALEAERLFRGNWIGVGRSDIVPDPGSFIALDIAGQNVILLRDKDGVLRAFANSCRHRGARLLNGAGSCKGIRCPFHSWFYGLDGALVSAPHMEAAKGFDRAENGLIAYEAEERLGFVFLRVGGEGELDARLGDFAQIHLPWPMETLKSVRRREFEVACNWKMFLEVFNEYYHLPFVHPDTVNNLYNAPNKADDVTGAFATQFGKTEGTGGLLESEQEHALPPMPGLQGEALLGARYTWVFPNMTFAANHDALWCYEAYPLGATRCKVVQTACFPEATVARPDFEARVSAYLGRLDAALEEDVEALLNQQAGMSCPDAMQGRFQPDLEPNVACFARWYSGMIRDQSRANGV